MPNKYFDEGFSDGKSDNWHPPSSSGTERDQAAYQRGFDQGRRYAKK